MKAQLVTEVMRLQQIKRKIMMTKEYLRKLEAALKDAQKEIKK